MHWGRGYISCPTAGPWSCCITCASCCVLPLRVPLPWPLLCIPAKHLHVLRLGHLVAKVSCPLWSSPLSNVLHVIYHSPRCPVGHPSKHWPLPQRFAHPGINFTEIHVVWMLIYSPQAGLAQGHVRSPNLGQLTNCCHHLVIVGTPCPGGWAHRWLGWSALREVWCMKNHTANVLFRNSLSKRLPFAWHARPQLSIVTSGNPQYEIVSVQSH